MALREIATFAAAYLTYFGVRALTEGAPWRAFDNAVALFRLESDLGLDWEGAVQSTVLRSQFLIDAANAVYIYGHWPVLIAAGILLFRYRPRSYYRLRNVCLLTGLVGLVVFALFPVAPPRLTDLPWSTRSRATPRATGRSCRPRSSTSTRRCRASTSAGTSWSGSSSSRPRATGCCGRSRS